MIEKTQRRNRISKQILEDLYIKEQLSARMIASKLSLEPSSVYRDLVYYGLNRSTSEALIVAHNNGRQIGRDLSGANNPQWKGGRLNKQGYIKILKPQHHRADCSGYVWEHVLVWEEFNQKQISKDMIIHHLNGDKKDNRIENLVVMARSEHIHQVAPFKERIKKLESEIARLKGLLENNNG